MADLSLNNPSLRKQVLRLVYEGSNPSAIADNLKLTLEDIKAIIKSDDFLEEDLKDDTFIERKESKEKLLKIRKALKTKGEKVLFSKLLDDEDKAALILELKEIALGESASMAHKLKAMEQLIKLAETPEEQGLTNVQTPAIIFQQFNAAIEVAQGEAAQYLKIPSKKSFMTKELTV